MDHPEPGEGRKIGCQQATLLAAQWYAKLAPAGPLHVVIQGDILPLIQYLNYNARLRYAGIQKHLIDIKHTALLELPNHTFAYLPREGNALADHLAGQGANATPPTSGIELHTNIRLPDALLRKAQLSHDVQEQTITLHERPHVHLPVLAAYWHQYPAHRMELARYLAKHTTSKPQAGHAVQYWRTSNDGKGRLYAQGPAAQRLPKQLRVLLFGRTHIEVDIIGAFYEIVRRTAASTSQLQSHRLPPIGQARAVLQQELHRQQPLKHAAPTAKQLLHIAINATATTVARHLTDLGYEATAAITALTAQVRAAAEATCQHLSEQPATGRQHYTARNRNFFHLEGIEAEYITHLVAGLQAEDPNTSIVLLHDGLLTAPLPSQATLTRLHQEALAKLQLCPDDHPFLLVQTHQETYNNIVQDLPPAPPGMQHALEAAIKAVNLTTLRHSTPTSRTYTRRH